MTAVEQVAETSREEVTANPLACSSKVRVSPHCRSTELNDLVKHSLPKEPIIVPIKRAVSTNLAELIAFLRYYLTTRN